MEEDTDFAEGHKGLRKSGVKRIVQVALWTILQSVVLFVSAGRIDMPRAWLFVAVSLGCFLVSAVLMAKVCPEIINQRGERKQGTKWWDKVFFAGYIPLIFILPLVAGLDVGRFQWSSISVHFALLGIVAYGFSSILGFWAMMTNRHFETTVRIQKERGHQVITTGPYKIVRHPGYVAGILMSTSTPLIIGSLFALIPAGIITLLLIVRTALEDKTLHNELPRYKEYTGTIRYRLLPGIW